MKKIDIFYDNVIINVEGYFKFFKRKFGENKEILTGREGNIFFLSGNAGEKS